MHVMFCPDKYHSCEPFNAFDFNCKCAFVINLGCYADLWRMFSVTQMVYCL